jgi:hypothetical protein
MISTRTEFLVGTITKRSEMDEAEGNRIEDRHPPVFRFPRSSSGRQFTGELRKVSGETAGDLVLRALSVVLKIIVQFFLGEKNRPNRATPSLTTSDPEDAPCPRSVASAVLGYLTEHQDGRVICP